MTEASSAKPGGPASIRWRILWSFVGVAAVPLVALALMAVPYFSSIINQQAQTLLAIRMTVAENVLSSRVAERGRSLAALAGAHAVVSDSPARVRTELASAKSGMGVTEVVVINNAGQVVASSGQGVGRPMQWPVLLDAARSASTTSFVDVVPQQIAVELGISQDVTMSLAAGGHLEQGEGDGELSIVAVAPERSPSGKPLGAVVAIDDLKGNQAFAQDVGRQVGADATIFQNGVRVATTILNAAGLPAVGTPVSDPIRLKVLAGAQPYQGQAMVGGKNYFAAYTPLRSQSGAPVGMLFVGFPTAPYNQKVVNFALVFLGVLGISLGLVIAGANTVSRQVARPLEHLSEAAVGVSAGDLTVHVPEEGFREAVQVGSAFNAMTASLRGLIGTVGGSAQRLDSVAGSIADSAREEAESAAREASAVSEAAATIEELTRSFQAVAAGANRVLEISDDALETAQHGNDTIQQGGAAIDKLASGSLDVREAADRLANVATDIGQVTVLISTIAEQTKILALNAAIEAARAGEAGKGFGVVSTQIRELADSTSRSSGRISALVAGIQDASSALTATAEQQEGAASDGVMASSQSMAAFGEILLHMQRTSDAAQEIASAADQQRKAAEQVAIVMQEVSASSTQTAGMAASLAGSAGEVEKEAQSLQDGLRGFRS